MKTHLPNALSAFRIVSTPLLLALAWRGAVATFLGLFALALLSDVLDGALARKFRCQSDFGARLDQWGDFALWLTLAPSSWWLWHDIVAGELAYVALALIAMVLPTIVAYAKYRAIPGYHTWSVKLGAIAMAVAIPALLLFHQPSLFRLASLFQLVCLVDELGITLLLDECRHDVPSLVHAARWRRATRSHSAG